MKTMSEIIEKLGNMVYVDMVSGFEEYVRIFFKHIIFRIILFYQWGDTSFAHRNVI